MVYRYPPIYVGFHLLNYLQRNKENKKERRKERTEEKKEMNLVFVSIYNIL